jgi:hypothetical protein
MRAFALSIAALGMAVSAIAADKVASGLKPGDRTAPFQVVDVTGPDRGQQLCLV